MTAKEVEIDHVKFGLIKDEITANLPSSWTISTLGESFKWGSGGTPRSGVQEYYAGGNIPWLIIGDLNDDVVNTSQTTITDQGLKDSSAKLVEPGTILIAMYGSIGKLGIAGKALATNQAIAFAYKNEIDPMYLFYFLMRIRGRLISLGKGATQLNISQTVIKALPFVIAPLNEQHRIVQKIEELFSELDSGNAALKDAKIKLGLFKQLLLRKAFSGELTKGLREGNGNSINDISKVYEELLELKRMNSSQRGRNRNQDKLSIKTNESIPLPKGWMWIRLSDLCHVTGGVTKNSKRNNLKLKRPFLRVANVYQNELRLSEIHEIGLEESELERVELRANDILLVEGNGSPDQIGRAALWDGSIPGCVHQNHLIKARSYGAVNPAYIIQFLMSEVGRRNIANIASSTSGLYTLNITKIENLVIPYCTLEEQNEVIDMLSEIDMNINRVENEISDSLSMVKFLRQSILEKAFSGQLVPQDPNDEPASELLARIKAEVTKSKPTKKKKAA